MLENLINLKDTESNTDDRTRRFFGNLHSRLETTSVLVIGAGAVGNEVIKNLVMIGVRNLTIIDFDYVTASNMNRCVFFLPSDHKCVQKVDAVFREIKLRFPQAKIRTVAQPIQQAPEEVWDVPLVIVAVDNNEARYYINLKLLSMEKDIFVINGAMARTFCETQVLLPKVTACLTCAWSQAYLDKLFAKMVRQNCDAFFYETVEHFPAISVISSLLGATMVSEAVKILIGYERWLQEKQWEPELIPALGQSIRYDIRQHEASNGKIYRNPRCVEIFCRQSDHS